MSRDEDRRAGELLSLWYRAGLPTGLDWDGYSVDLVRDVVARVETGRGDLRRLTARAFNEYVRAVVKGMPAPACGADTTCGLP